MNIVARRFGRNRPDSPRPVPSARAGSISGSVARGAGAWFGLAASAILVFALAGCQSSSAPLPTTIVVPGSRPSTSLVATATPVDTGSHGPIAACTSASLTIALTPKDGLDWQAGANLRSAVFTLTNAGSAACRVKALAQPLLVNGDGLTLITGAAAPDSEWIEVAPGGTLKTTVQTGNLCTKSTLIAPLLVAFTFPGGGDTVIALPANPTDLGADPGCQGDPGTPSGTIEMQAWSK
jgi:hypothetical protein